MDFLAARDETRGFNVLSDFSNPAKGQIHAFQLHRVKIVGVIKYPE